MSRRLLIDYDDEIQTSTFSERCPHTGNTIYTHIVDYDDIIAEVKRRRESFVYNKEGNNVLALIPNIMEEAWNRELGEGEDYTAPEHREFYNKKMASPEAEPFIIYKKKGLLIR